jgi:Rps23 Pro-64 3,4-dihydroxylase Tpa1-like proline 4-hydroxylase
MLYAFQSPEVIREVSVITGLKTLLPDPKLYAGGISRMEYKGFLEPHLDNSHDSTRSNYRVLNLLYYVTPNWTHESGGNFELWDQGPKGESREIVSAFNRLLIMATHDSSWHSVNEVREKKSPRLCLSNYYFSPDPLNHPYFHVTYFRGRPEEPIRDAVLAVDSSIRMGIRKVLKKGVHFKPQTRKDI